MKMCCCLGVVRTIGGIDGSELIDVHTRSSSINQRNHTINAYGYGRGNKHMTQKRLLSVQSIESRGRIWRIFNTEKGDNLQIMHR